MYKQEKVLLGGASGLGLSVTGAACYKQLQQPEPQPRHGAEMPVLGWLKYSSCGDSVRGALGRPLTNGELLLFIIFGDAGWNPGLQS